MSETTWDRRVMLAQRQQAHIARWLDSLPAHGWQGTPKETADALAHFATHGDYSPQNPGGMLADLEPFIRSRGWQLEFGRSRIGRFIRLKRGEAARKDTSR